MRWVVVLGALALLGWLVVTVGHWAVADLQFRYARDRLDGWETTRTVPAVKAWREVLDTLKMAAANRPADPNVYEQLARLYLLRVGQAATPLAAAHARQALAHYRTATALRPASPFAWAGIAWLKWRLGTFDAEFDHALARALALGAWEPAVLLSVAEIGLNGWPSLDAAQRQAVLATLERASVRESKSLVALARQAGQLGRLCELVGGDAVYARVCITKR